MTPTIYTLLPCNDFCLIWSSIPILNHLISIAGWPRILFLGPFRISVHMMHPLLFLRFGFLSLLSLSVASVPRAGAGNDGFAYQRHNGARIDLDAGLEPHIMQASPKFAAALGFNTRYYARQAANKPQAPSKPAPPKPAPPKPAPPKQAPPKYNIVPYQPGGKSDKRKMLETHRQGTPEEIKTYIKDQQKLSVYVAVLPLGALKFADVILHRNKNPECKGWRDCKCQEKVPGSVGGSCANGVCKCGAADKTI